MTVVVTGRSVLSVLYAEDGETTLDALPTKLGAEESAVLRVIQSLAAARLVSEETTDGVRRRIVLTDAGRRWCNAELAHKVEVTPERTAALPLSVRPSPAGPDLRAAADSDLRLKAPLRHGDRMRGVHVVRVKTRQRLNPLDASMDASLEEADRPAEKEEAASRPPATSAPSFAPVPMDEAPPIGKMAEKAPGRAESNGAPKPGARYTVDRDGFVTHIDGKRIA
jgi:DNA-binding MarR family transcriptional regulator